MNAGDTMFTVKTSTKRGTFNRASLTWWKVDTFATLAEAATKAADLDRRGYPVRVVHGTTSTAPAVDWRGAL